jgi:predicted acetyltransferase
MTTDDHPADKTKPADEYRPRSGPDPRAAAVSEANSLQFRSIHPEEYLAFANVTTQAFGEHLSEHDLEAERAAIEFDRSLAAFEDGRPVGTSAVLTLQLTVPGNTTIPCGGLTWVGVLPTHHRRGILTEHIRQHFADMRARGEIVSALGASESNIYGRFGYGPATQLVGIALERAHARFLHAPQPFGRLRMIEAEEAGRLIPPLFDTVRQTQPGEVSRSTGWWQAHFADLEHHRDGAGPMIHVVHETGERPDGWVSYRIKDSWTDGLANNEARVVELFAESHTLRALLWSYCLELDLLGTLTSNMAAPDDPLRFMLADSRRLRTTELRDGLWVRVLDIPAALSARAYRAPGRLAIHVLDSFLPENTGSYLLEAGPDGALCTPTTADPDLALDAATLASAYLGGTAFSVLGAAGRVREERPGTLALADLMFGTSRAPQCVTDF